MWWAWAFAENTWLTQTALTLILILLLVVGIVIFAMGLRDLVHDLWHTLHDASHKKGHA